MSAMSPGETLAMAAAISSSLSRKFSGAWPSNFSANSRTAASPRFSMSARMPSTVLRTLASASATSASLLPRFK
jgi:hypothetical protein